MYRDIFMFNISKIYLKPLIILTEISTGFIAIANFSHDLHKLIEDSSINNYKYFNKQRLDSSFRRYCEIFL